MTAHTRANGPRPDEKFATLIGLADFTGERLRNIEQRIGSGFQHLQTVRPF